MEGLALTGAWVDREKGLLSLIVLEMGVSSRLCALLQPGEPVVVMGPTGTPTEIPENETRAARRRRPRQRRAVLDRQGAQGAAATACVYFAGYRNGADLFKRDEIEAATDQVDLGDRHGRRDRAARPQDAHFRGNIVQAMVAYAEGTARAAARAAAARSAASSPSAPTA